MFAAAENIDLDHIVVQLVLGTLVHDLCSCINTAQLIPGLVHLAESAVTNLADNLPDTGRVRVQDQVAMLLGALFTIRICGAVAVAAVDISTRHVQNLAA